LAEGLKRGDVVVVSIPGEYGKPRPAIVVQSDMLSDRSEGVIVCPTTTNMLAVEWVRPTLRGNAENGLRTDSQVMADKVQTVHIRRVGRRIGRVSDDDLRRIDISLQLVLGFFD